MPLMLIHFRYATLLRYAADMSLRRRLLSFSLLSFHYADFSPFRHIRDIILL